METLPEPNLTHLCACLCQPRSSTFFINFEVFKAMYVIMEAKTKECKFKSLTLQWITEKSSTAPASIVERGNASSDG